MSEPWSKTLGRIIWWIFSRPWAAFMAVGWPLMIAYGLVQPRTATGAVTVVRDGSPPEAEEVEGGLILIFLVWVTCAYLTWRFCWRPIRSAWRTQDRARA